MRVKLRLVYEDKDKQSAALMIGTATLVRFQETNYGTDTPEWVAVRPGPDAYRVHDSLRPFPTLLGCLRWYLKRMKIRSA